MKFIKLTAIDGSYRYININFIVYFFSKIKGETYIHYHDEYLIVKESPQEILNLINEA